MGDTMAPVRPSWDEYFLGIAKAVAVRADCTRRQVGAVIVRDNRIVATGYNGGPSGGPSCLSGQCPRGQLDRDQMPGYMDGNHDFSNCISIHAEMNALLYADRSKIEGGVLYSTDQPCNPCWKNISNSGVVRAVWPGGQVILSRGGDYWVLYKDPDLNRLVEIGHPLEGSLT